MLRRWCVFLAGVMLLGGSAMAAEITFQVSEVDLGQDVATITAIGGNEWLTFGIDMLGESLLLYGPPNPDPFPPTTDSNGIFEGAADSFEIVFNDPVTDLEVDWFSPSLASSRLVAFDPSGVATQVEVNPGGVGQDTAFLSGTIKRLVIESDPGTLCIANLRFQLIAAFPVASAWSLGTTCLLLLVALATVLTWRGRRARRA